VKCFVSFGSRLNRSEYKQKKTENQRNENTIAKTAGRFFDFKENRMIRIKQTLNTQYRSSSLTPSQSPNESYVERMRMFEGKENNKAPKFTKATEIFPFLVKKNESYRQFPSIRSSFLTKSLKTLGTSSSRKVPSTKSPKRRPSFSMPTRMPSPQIISPSLSSGGSLSSIKTSPLLLPRSITPIASPVNHQDLALCAELDIDPLTLDQHGALKRGIDLQGIALCEQNGIHLHELQKYKAVRRDIDITGISMCKTNGVALEVLHQMNAVEPNVDISGIAICEAIGVDIYTLQDYGFIEPGRSLRTIAMLNEQGYDLEQIFKMDPGYDCT